MRRFNFMPSKFPGKNWKQQLGYSLLFLSGAVVIEEGIRRLFWGNKQNKDKKDKLEIEDHKSDLRKEEAQIDLDNQLTVEDVRFDHQKEIEEIKFRNKRSIITLKMTGVIPPTDNDTDELLPSENLDDLVNRPIDPTHRILLMNGTPVQNRDIFILAGCAGLGKSFLILQIMATITNGSGKHQIMPTKDSLTLPYKGLYYDIEMTDEEWQTKHEKRSDLKNIERVPSRGKNYVTIISDIKKRLKKYKWGNVVIAIDPISELGMMKKHVSSFINELAAIQEEELERGNNIIFLLVNHIVKSPKGKGLQDMSGPKEWADYVKTVVSFKPYGDNEQYRMLTIEKTKNGSELYRGQVFIEEAVKDPHLNFRFDAEQTKAFHGNGCVVPPSKPNNTQSNNPQQHQTVPKRRGKTALIPPEMQARIYDMRVTKKLTGNEVALLISKEMSEYLGHNITYHPAEIDRIVQDVAVIRGK